MNTPLLSITVAGTVYFMWFLFVVALTSSLKEIKKSAWHYKFSAIYDGRPKNSCDYGKMLMIAPLLYILIVTALALWAFGVVIRFILNWLICPFFDGKIPQDGLSKSYFEDLINPNTLQYGIRTKKFMKLSPFFWILIVGFLSAMAAEFYRVLTGLSSRTENNILLITAIVSAAILIINLTINRLSLKTVYAMAKERLCRNIPVVE